MEIILTQFVKNLGEKDDVVKVKPGYARNFLIPQGMALLATATNRKILEEKKRQAAHKIEFVRLKAQEFADKLAGTRVIIETLAGADGKLFGSVTALMIAQQLNEKGFEVDRKMITFDDIRQTGEYTATIHFHRDVKAEIEIEVTRKEG
jgi:large subunit ribosomal protein L9